MLRFTSIILIISDKIENLFIIVLLVLWRRHTSSRCNLWENRLKCRSTWDSLYRCSSRWFKCLQWFWMSSRYCMYSFLKIPSHHTRSHYVLKKVVLVQETLVMCAARGDRDGWVIVWITTSCTKTTRSASWPYVCQYGLVVKRYPCISSSNML